MFRLINKWKVILCLSILAISEFSQAQWITKWSNSMDGYVIHYEQPPGVLSGDFNSDGYYEIVIFDESKVIILDGTSGSTLFRIDALVPTRPLIIDIDKDGRDELIVSDTESTTAYEYIGSTGAINSQKENMPTSIKISQNYPNPFNLQTSIQYSIPRSGVVKIMIFNEVGQCVRTLIDNKFVESGEHSVIWDGKDDNDNFVSSGTYFYQIIMDDFVSTKKAVLVK